MFINKKDLVNLENKIKEELRQEFDGRIIEVKNYADELIKATLPKKKKSD